MTRKLGVAAGAALIAVLVLLLNVLPSSAQAPPPIATEFLTDRAVFTDDVTLQMKIKLDGQKTDVVNVRDPSRTVVVRFTVQPGAQFPWHSHAGPVVVNVVSGELTYVAADAYPLTDLVKPSPHGEELIRGEPGRWSRHDPRPGLMPPGGPDKPIFAYQPREG